MTLGAELGKLGLIQIGEEDSVEFGRNVTVASTLKEDDRNDVVLQSDFQKPSEAAVEAGEWGQVRGNGFPRGGGEERAEEQGTRHSLIGA
ncbi:hypothetical protein V6N11_044300 [Hibiscus sabdariffa]|uniref:Uncharacterized protein n=1 Tax=Hibiscus sabdariffa TaxID=183260 RepID=A0ABR2RF08_9ROSI